MLVLDMNSKMVLDMTSQLLLDMTSQLIRQGDYVDLVEQGSDIVAVQVSRDRWQCPLVLGSTFSDYVGSKGQPLVTGSAVRVNLQ